MWLLCCCCGSAPWTALWIAHYILHPQLWGVNRKISNLCSQWHDYECHECKVVPVFTSQMRKRVAHCTRYDSKLCSPADSKGAKVNNLLFIILVGTWLGPSEISQLSSTLLPLLKLRGLWCTRSTQCFDVCMTCHQSTFCALAAAKACIVSACPWQRAGVKTFFFFFES